jgi:hypothetical protein
VLSIKPEHGLFGKAFRIEGPFPFLIRIPAGTDPEPHLFSFGENCNTLVGYGVDRRLDVQLIKAEVLGQNIPNIPHCLGAARTMVNAEIIAHRGH